LSLINDVHTNGTFGEFTALRYMIWDPKAQKVVGFWQDNSAPVLLQFTGTWANNILSLNWTEDEKGKKTEYRDVFSGFSPDGFQEVMETRVIPDAANKTAQAKPEEWKRMMTVKYTKFVPTPGMWRPGVGPRPATLPPANSPPATTPPATPPPSGKPPGVGNNKD